MPVTTGLQTVGFGANTRISYLVQTAAGAIDTDPVWTVVPFASGEMTVQAEQMNDNSMTGDRNELEPRSGTVNGQMKLSGKFRPECFDDLLEAAAQGTWGVKYALTGLTVTVASAASGFTFTRSTGSWVTDGVAVGDIITWGGFAAVGNNKSFQVTAVTALAVTCGNATGCTAVVSDTDVTATTGSDYLKVGSTQRRVAWEIYHSDTDEYLRMIDTEISNFNLSLNANGEISFDMTAIGGTELDLGATVTVNPVSAYFTPHVPWAAASSRSSKHSGRNLPDSFICPFTVPKRGSSSFLSPVIELSFICSAWTVISPDANGTTVHSGVESIAPAAVCTKYEILVFAPNPTV